MTIVQLSAALSDALFGVIFLLSALKARRQPRRATVDALLFFGAIAAFIGVGRLAAAQHASAVRAIEIVSESLLLCLPYLLLRLTDDLATVPARVLRGALAGLALALLAAVLSPLRARPHWITLLDVAYFVGLVVYSTLVFLHHARTARGVTRRRMLAVATGSGAFGLIILLIGVQVLVPPVAPLLRVVEQLCAMVVALAYLVGFAPPRWLRRAWQEPEVTAFLRHAVRVARRPDTQEVVRELAAHAAQALGATHAMIYRWDAAAQVLRAEVDGVVYERAPGQFLSGRVFLSQRPLFSANPRRDDPENAALYARHHASAVLVAPITLERDRLGVLIVYAARPSIFAEDDLALAEVLAEQLGSVLDGQRLAAEADHVRAQAASARLKEEFVAAAAHDLRTPLTSILGTAQLLERRLVQGTAPEVRHVTTIVQNARRMNGFISELLTTARLEQAQFVGERTEVDLAALARAVCQAHQTEAHRINLVAPQPVVGRVDPARLAQVVENLLSNAVKYSPAGSPIAVSVCRAGSEAHLTVSDQGMGIPAADLPHVFERFRRGSNAAATEGQGQGLGLYLCQRIVAEHGGAIWATSAGPGQGSTLHVRLPALAG